LQEIQASLLYINHDRFETWKLNISHQVSILTLLPPAACIPGFLTVIYVL